MIIPAQDIVVHTFTSETSKGSPQLLHIFDDEKKLNDAYMVYDVEDEFDHSFIYFNQSNIVVKWKNKAGEIQFCGSGAYAISWYFLKYLNKMNISISSSHLKLMAEKLDDQIILKIPKKLPILVEKDESYSIFCDNSSGIFFIQLNNLKELKELDFDHLCSIINHPNEIHGLCAFVWDKNDEGYLRYFTPWHGRDEDYVTGSIHQYLGPLIQELFSITAQRWTQVSQAGGQLNSKVFKDHIALCGQCILRQEENTNLL